MFEFFNNALGYFETAFEFLLSIVESLISFIALIPTAIALPMALVDFLPVVIGASITAVVSTQVIKLIIGR